MSLKDLIGMRIKFKKYNGANTSEGTVVDCYIIRSVVSGDFRDTERFVIMEDDGEITIKDWGNIYGVRIDGEESINIVKYRTKNIKLEAPEEIPRTHLIDMED